MIHSVISDVSRDSWGYRFQQGILVWKPRKLKRINYGFQRIAFILRHVCVMERGYLLMLLLKVIIH